MRKQITAGLILIIFTSLNLSANAAIKAGTACKQLGLTSTSAGKKFTCIKSGKKLIWDKGTIIQATDNPASIPETTSDLQVTPITKFTPITNCKLNTNINEAGDLGFPRKNTFIPSVGNIKSYVIFVDFTDVPSDPRQITEWKKYQIPTAENQFKIMS